MYDDSLGGCFQDGVVYRNDPVRGITNFNIPNVMSAEDCQTECQNDIDCQFWTWNSPNFKRNQNTCWLKAGKGQIRAVSGKISGPRTCPGNI